MQVNDVKLECEFYRAFERQSKFDAKIAASLVRILRGEERGVARGVGHELRELLLAL